MLLRTHDQKLYTFILRFCQDNLILGVLFEKGIIEIWIAEDEIPVHCHSSIPLLKTYDFSRY